MLKDADYHNTDEFAPTAALIAVDELLAVRRLSRLESAAGANEGNSYGEELARIALEIEEDRSMLEDVMDSLFHIAKSDGALHESEVAFLSEVAGIFGLQDRFRCIMARHVLAAENEPYAILGIDPCVSDEEARAHYLRLVRENHPDLHIAAGMPAEMVAIANERLAAITTAWNEIARERGL